MQQTTIPTRRNVKALLCQVSPFYKQKEKTIDRLLLSFQKYSEKDKIDIVVFPELAFVGYNFQSQEDAMPFAVSQNEGVQFGFARKLAMKLNTYVTFGYMEKVIGAEQKVALFSSAAVIDREGVLLANYRKSHLYYNDKNWAEQGNGFQTFTLKNVDNQALECSLAIGMDIHPKNFTSGQFQLADHLVKTKSDLLIFLANWIDSQKESIHRNDVAATFSYWISRLAPVLLEKKSVLMLEADRVGVEFDYFAKKSIRFYGSSAAIMLNPHKILSNLDVQNQGFLMIETFLP